MGALSRLRDPVGVGYCRAVLPGAAHTSSFSGSPQIPPRAELVTPRAVILQGLGHTALRQSLPTLCGWLAVSSPDHSSRAGTLSYSLPTLQHLAQNLAHGKDKTCLLSLHDYSLDLT